MLPPPLPTPIAAPSLSVKSEPIPYVMAPPPTQSYLDSLEVDFSEEDLLKMDQIVV